VIEHFLPPKRVALAGQEPKFTKVRFRVGYAAMSLERATREIQGAH
jgi:hypothetical protein